MNGTIRAGIIGASGNGWAVGAHLAALSRLPDFTVAAVATTRKHSAMETARAFDVPLAFGEAAELIASPEVDLVTICVKVPKHDALIRAAVAAGKHVYCEWPLALDGTQARELAELSASSGRLHLAGLQGVRSPSVRFVRDLVAGGRIGQVLSASFQVMLSGFGEAGVTEARRQIIDQASGATLLTVGGGHALAVLRAVLGPFAAFSAQLDTRRPRVTIAETGQLVEASAPDQVVIAGSLHDGATATVAILSGAPPAAAGFSLRIVGSEATLAIEPAVPGLPCQIAPWDIRLLEGETSLPLAVPVDVHDPASALAPGPAASVAHAYQGLSRAVRTGEPAEPGFAFAAGIHRLMDLAVRGSASGQRQTL
ncbi:Gfo/Idh/MocA family protein [Nonomuraea sp. NPDC050394]|uniref:Gfo/Idh/MocA family protein n=1 Tax=Nonomuraea sp. NPDC050394 TaxID=3364363 RepID=UPI0037B27C2E